MQCRTCRHWRTHTEDRRGDTVPTPMLRHGMADCRKGESWRYLPARTDACGHYEALSPAGQAKREQWMVEAAQGTRT